MVSGNLTARHPSACRQAAAGSLCDEHGRGHRFVEDSSWHMHVVDRGDCMAALSHSVSWITRNWTCAGLDSSPFYPG
jgi:hypothetical protein